MSARGPGSPTPVTSTSRDGAAAPRPARAAVAARWAAAGTAERLALVLALLTVVVQISYPLLDGPALTAATIGSVMTFAAASLVGAAALGGARAALGLLVVAGGLGLLAEAVGVSTGIPFGDYAYSGTLGPQVLGVPVVVPLAWTMMAWPTHLAGRTVGRAVARRTGWRPGAVAVPAAALALAGWDLFLDPQMVEAGHWAWSHPTPAIPGIPGIPLSNYAGWLLVALVIQAALHLVLPHRSDAPQPSRGGAAEPRALQLPSHVLLLGWTWLGSALANAVFFGRPAVAVWGLVVMGLVVGPYLHLVRRGHR